MHNLTSGVRLQPRVSVLIVTYNQENYVTQAIESALMQEANFDFEIVIGEDCSTDSTRKIVCNYANRHPTTIHAILHPSNIGPTANFCQTLSNCRGEFVALLEGDDYWTSSEKLQKQVDFLDQHPECALCFHNAIRIDEDGSNVRIPYDFAGQKRIFILEDLWQYNFIASCTAMFRKDLLGRLPEWYNSLSCGDWALYILCAQHGKIGYVDKVLGVYRIHRGGLWNKLGNIPKLEAQIAFYETMNANLGFRYNDTVELMISKRKNELALARRVNEMAAAVLPPKATVIVSSKANEDLPRFGAQRVWAFPGRTLKETRQLFTSGAAGSVAAPWIGAGAIYEFCLYGGRVQETLLASVSVAHDGMALNSAHPGKGPGQNEAFISADPNPVPPGSGPGTTVISWSTGDGSPGVIYVFIKNQRVTFPATSAAAIEEMELLRSKGAQFLLAPRNAFGLFERYPELKEHLERHYQLLASEENVCLIYDLRELISNRHRKSVADENKTGK